MTPLFAPRAADEFQRALEGRTDGSGAPRRDLGELLAVVDALHGVPEVEARQDFVDDLRTRLMTAAETDLVPAPPVLRAVDPAPLREDRAARPAARRPVRLGTAAATLALLAGAAGTAAASANALPGDALYPVKRGIEDVRTAVQPSEADTGRSLLQESATRLDEARRLQREGGDPLLVAQAVRDFRVSAEEGGAHLFRSYADGGDAADVTDVRTFAAERMPEIRTLASTGDQGVDDSLLDAADTLASLDRQARGLCDDCDPRAAVQVPLSLASAAGAPSVVTLLARPVAQASADVAAQAAQARAARAARAQQQRTRELRAGAAAAEAAASQVPAAGGGSTAGGATPSTPDTPVTSVLTPSGGLVPTVTGGTTTAVKGLVRGVTGTVRTVTKTGTPLDSTVGGVTDTVDGVADGLGDTVDGLLGGN